jgi:hypothetical protein
MSIIPSTLGGGPYNGWSPKQTCLNYKSSENIMARKIVVKSWNTQYASGVFNGKSRIITPFRAVNNLGDFLSRKNYICGGPNTVTPDRYKRKNNIGSVAKACDNSGVPASTCNPKFVPDSSDYVRFKKLRAVNQLYNDQKFGGDKNNASQQAKLFKHRF